jgi:flagellar assembly protein FliH
MGRVLRAVEHSTGRYLLAVPRGEATHLEREPFAHAPSHFHADIDLERIVRESSRMIDDATDDAHHVISAAHMRAQQLLAKAQNDAEEIEKHAQQDGMALGRADALALIEDELREARETMKELLESARAQRRVLIEQAESEIVRLGYALAESIVQGEVDKNDDVVVNVARAAIKRLVERERVTVRVNPDDLERMRAHREDMLALGDIREVRVIGDPGVGRGGVVLETDGGAIDARITTQLQESRRALLVDDGS